jgi:hypothetical protein
MPAVQRIEGGQHLLVDAVAEPLQDAFLDDVAAGVDGGLS